MKRAVETAQIIAKRLKSRSLLRARLLRECVPSLPPWERDNPAAPAAEVIKRGKDQADRAYRRYLRRAAGRDTCEVLVCHGNLIRYLVSRVLAMGRGGWWSLGTAHCGITVIRIPAKGDIVLDAYNDTGHLPEKLRTF